MNDRYAAIPCKPCPTVEGFPIHPRTLTCDPKGLIALGRDLRVRLGYAGGPAENYRNRLELACYVIASLGPLSKEDVSLVYRAFTNDTRTVRARRGGYQGGPPRRVMVPQAKCSSLFNACYGAIASSYKGGPRRLPTYRFHSDNYGGRPPFVRIAKGVYGLSEHGAARAAKFAKRLEEKA